MEPSDAETASHTTEHPHDLTAALLQQDHIESEEAVANAKSEPQVEHEDEGAPEGLFSPDESAKEPADLNVLSYVPGAHVSGLKAVFPPVHTVGSVVKQLNAGFVRPPIAFLHRAACEYAKRGMLDTMKLLFQEYNKIPVDGRNLVRCCTALLFPTTLTSSQKGRTILMEAAQYGHTEIVYYVCDILCANLDLTDRVRLCASVLPSKGMLHVLVWVWQEGNAAVHFAARGGHADVVKFLAARGCIIRQLNKTKYDAFLLACTYGRASVVDVLLKHKHIDPNVTAPGDVTGLMLAAAKGASEVVRSLCHCTKVNLNARDCVSAALHAFLPALCETALHLLQSGLNAKDHALRYNHRATAFFLEQVMKGNVERG